MSWPGLRELDEVGDCHAFSVIAQSTMTYLALMIADARSSTSSPGRGIHI